MYESALSVSILTKNVEELVPVVLARAGFERRRLEAASEGGQEEAFDRVMAVLMEGIGKVREGLSHLFWVFAV